MKKRQDKWKPSKRQIAVALGYEPESDRAPRVVAKGAGPVAETIIRLAREAGVPVREDSDLALLLGKLDVEEEIPPELYQVVAEVLAYIYRVNANMNTQPPSGKP